MRKASFLQVNNKLHSWRSAPFIFWQTDFVSLCLYQIVSFMWGFEILMKVSIILADVHASVTKDFVCIPVIEAIVGIYVLCIKLSFQCVTASRVRLKHDGTRWSTGGEVKGKLANGVGSQYSHTTSERGVSSITTADAHTSAASSRLNWCPRQLKWTRPFRRKKKSGFCACAITFQTQSTVYCRQLTVYFVVRYEVLKTVLWLASFEVWHCVYLLS